VRRRPAYRLSALTGLLLFGSTIAAAPPARRDLEALVLTNSEHYLDLVPEEDHHNGIWLFDPETETWFRARPFYSSSSFVSAMDSFYGDDGRLAVDGDRLVFESWPAEFVFDALSWKLINRIPTTNPPGSLGWALQGPVLGSEELQGTGLPAGRYGFARCVLDEISNVHLWGPRPCEPLFLPGGAGLVETSDGRNLFLSTDAPVDIGRIEHLRAFDSVSFTEASVLGFDCDRRGFWRADDSGASFFPASDGAIHDSTFRLDFDFPPFDGPDGALIASLYHFSTGRLFSFGLHLEWPAWDERFFFSIDPETGRRFEHPLPEVEFGELPFFPVSFASFGPAPDTYEQLIPIVAETPGRRGTFWTTDLWLFNPSGAPVTVEISRITRPGEGRSIDLPAHGSMRIAGVLSWAGGGTGGDGTTHDALRVVSPSRWAEQLVAVGRISTLDAQTGGSYGHVVTAVPYPWGYSNHGVFLREDEELFNVRSAGVSVSVLDLDLRPPGKFRHNLGLVNPSDEVLSIEIGWGYSNEKWSTYQSDHPEGWRQRVTVEPHSVRVVDLEGLFPPEISGAWPPQLAILGEHPLPIWFSMIDEQTGDATFVPYSLYSHRTRDPSWYGDDDPFYRMVMPVVARTSGRNGSAWTTDLFGMRDDRGLFAPYFHPEPDEGSGGAGELFLHTLDGVFPSDLDAWIEELSSFNSCSMEVCAVTGWRTIFPDIVGAFPDCAGVENVIGGLELVTGSWFSGFSRTYTTRPDGGTYGSMLPLYPPGGWPVQHFAGIEVSEATRINVGFFNGDHDHDVTHRVTLYSAEGSVAAEREFVVGSLDSRLESLEELFGRGFESGTYGLTVLPLDGIDDEGKTYQGHSWAYVSVIDQATNDPINLW